MDLKKHLSAKLPVTVEFDDDTAQIYYRPHAYKGRAQALAVGLKDNPAFVGVNEVLLDLIAEWDITDGEDEAGQPVPMPVSLASLAELPFVLKAKILRAIMEDIRDPKEPTPLPVSLSTYPVAANGVQPQTMSSFSG